MKWLPIKMNFLPLIFQEINNVTEEYITLLNKIRQKESKKEKSKQKVNPDNQNKEESPSRRSNKNQTQTESEYENIKENENYEENENENEKDNDEELGLLIKRYNGLRLSISRRINELEDFYEDNIEDVRVSNFEKARLRLKKLLMYSYDNINKIENSSQQKNIFIKENNNLFNKKITEDTKKKILENNIPLEKQIIKERNKEEEKVKKKLLGSVQNQKRMNKKENMSNKKRVIKVRGDEGFLKQTEKARISSVKTESENLDFDFDDYSKCREIVFKIRLNQDEYKLLLKEKKNKGHVSPYLFK